MDIDLVLLAPLLALAAVLLLGFAGCDKVFGLPHVEPPPPPFLTLRVRVPMALTVREIIFGWDPPNPIGDTKTLTKPDPTGIDGNDNVFDHVLTGDPVMGSWTATCKVTVGGGSQLGAEDSGTFVLPIAGSTNPVATFQATVDPATNDPMTLAVTYVGAA